MAKPTIATLRGACRGQVITPDDPGYDAARHYDRLASIKKTYDPGNLFHINQNIKPS